MAAGVGKGNPSPHDARRDATGGAQAMADDVLQGYRKSIDNIDAALVHLLAERFKVTQAVGRHKAASGLPAAR